MFHIVVYYRKIQDFWHRIASFWLVQNLILDALRLPEWRMKYKLCAKLVNNF